MGALSGMKKNPHQPHRAPKMPCELEVVHKPSREVTFLDSRITVDLRRGVIFTDVYDKRKDIQIPLIRGIWSEAPARR